jgi:hypothetical protein
MSYSEIENRLVLKTKKDHQCAWCGEKIKSGESAQYRVYVFDDFTRDWMHPECYGAMGKLPRDDWAYQEGWMPGDFKRGTTECV